MNKRIGALVLAVIMALLLVAGPLSTLTAQAAGPVTLKFHYTRPDNNYSGWDLWFWADGINGSAYAFSTGENEAVATVTVPANSSKVGFIVRQGGDNWTNKDPSTDRLVDNEYADLYKVVSGTIDVYLTSGQAAFTVVPGDDVVLDDDATEPAPVEASYYVAGTDGLCGVGWDPGYAGNKMTLNAAGLYEKTFNAVPAGEHEFKITDGTWDNSWGKDGGWDNYILKLTEEKNVTITFNADTKAINVILSAPEQPYYVAGVKELCGNEWACDDAANKMTLNAEGLYEKTYEGVVDGTYEFKVTDGTWTNSWGNGGSNYSFEVTELSNVTITFDPATKEITVTVTKAELPFYVAGTADLCGSEWANNDPANKMSLNAEGLYEKFYQSVPAGTHQFKVTDGTWDNCWGDNGNNYSFTTTTETNVTITFNDATKEITVTTVAVVPYYVAGTEELCGEGWNPGFAGNKMSLNAEGLYEKTFKSVPAGKHEFKVTDGTRSNSWGDNGNNYVFETTEEHNVTITFDPATKEINVILSDATPADPVLPPDPADYDITIKVHYYRADGNYDSWEVHMWNGVESLSATREFDEVDENGWKVATYYADASDTWVGFIIKKPDWTKDPDGDRKIDISNVVSGTVHVYAESGSALNDFITDKSEATLGAKIIAAVYDSQTDVLTVTTSMPIEEDPNTAFTMEGPDGEMAITSVTQVGTSSNYIVEYVGQINSDEVFTVYYNGAPCVVTVPNIYSTEQFEAEYTYTGSDLGANWTAEGTTFRLWAPTASAVSVNLYATGSDSEAGAAALGTYAMTKDVNGTWIVTIHGDLNGVYYTYSVTRKGETVEACDPYARTTGVNGNRAMVINLDSTDPEGWENDDYVTVDNYTDAVIWELHVRDFSIDASSGMTNKGKYLAFTEKGTTVPGTDIATGVDYMKQLGINYVHLLPVYDINSVDETVGGYNWGYDPKNYNVPEGSYSTDPYNGAVRVNEFKQMVQSLHEAGIGVVMDVVYNHVADAGSFCFNQIVPGYFSRIMDDGSYNSNSGCGNDTASERSMVSKYIVDSVLYWAEEYHIDGFRWDLVGLIDYETINATMAAVHEVNPDIIFYGEGWEMCSWTTKEGYVDKMTIQNNADKVNNGDDVFAFFNDTVRNTLHGGVFDHTAKGFIAGGVITEYMWNTLFESFKGASRWGSKNTVCPTPLQTVNYASCHDNYTLIDNITLDSPEATREQHVAMNNLAAAYYLTAQGVPFIHAGEEMLRSKPDASAETGYNHNTYAAGDEINSIKWSTLANEEVMTTNQYYAGLIDFRMAHPALRQTDAAAIENSVFGSNSGDSGAIAFFIDGVHAGDGKLYIAFNPQREAVTVTLPTDSKWEVYVKGDKAGTEVLEIIEGTVEVPAISTLIAVMIPDSPLDNLDLTELRAIYEELDHIDLDLYTEESAALVEQLVQESMEIVSSENPTQEQIDNIVAALREAIDALVPVGSETEPTDPEETEPTEPETEPTEPVTEPTEPETEPTEPETEPTEPETTAPEATQKPTEKPSTGDNVQTGDAFQTAWFIVLAVSAMATAALIATRKKLF